MTSKMPGSVSEAPTGHRSDHNIRINTAHIFNSRDYLARISSPTLPRLGPDDLRQLFGALPHLGSDTLGFRPIHRDDVAWLWDATRNPLFNRFLTWTQPESMSEAAEQIDALLAANESREVAAFACFPIGDPTRWAAIYRFTPWKDGLEMGLWTHPDFWGSGWGTRIATLAVNAGFEATAAHTMYAKTANENHPAQAVLRKCGLVPGGAASAPTNDGRLLVGTEWSIGRARYAEITHRSGSMSLGLASAGVNPGDTGSEVVRGSIVGAAAGGSSGAPPAYKSRGAESPAEHEAHA
ncbi:MAG: GNAT family N-acetyltransferase [Burkholderiaceae bacterium]|nr:GNAT family N-acetyltransferase [Burkholderiaceae bacterium]